jgi:hypothetical protein
MKWNARVIGARLSRSEEKKPAGESVEGMGASNDWSGSGARMRVSRERDKLTADHNNLGYTPYTDEPTTAYSLFVFELNTYIISPYTCTCSLI